MLGDWLFRRRRLHNIFEQSFKWNHQSIQEQLPIRLVKKLSREVQPSFDGIHYIAFNWLMPWYFDMSMRCIYCPSTEKQNRLWNGILGLTWCDNNIVLGTTHLNNKSTILPYNQPAKVVLPSLVSIIIPTCVSLSETKIVQFISLSSFWLPLLSFVVTQPF